MGCIGVAVVKYVKNLLGYVCFILMPLSASAEIIYTFDMYQDVALVENISADDTFSIAFADDTDFASGVSWDDIRWFGYDTNELGSGVISDFLEHYDAAQIAEFFSFSDLGNGSWQMDILAGVTGINTRLAFTTLDLVMQFGQSNGPSGPTHLFIGEGSNVVILHSGDRALTFSANSVQVPNPSSFALMVFGLIMFAVRRKFK